MNREKRDLLVWRINAIFLVIGFVLGLFAVVIGDWINFIIFLFACVWAFKIMLEQASLFGFKTWIYRRMHKNSVFNEEYLKNN